MKKYFILLAGSPGTGKTYLMNKLRERFPDMYEITLDEIKEYYADSIGFDNLEERAEQERSKVYPFYYKALALYMEAGKKVVVSEYPFSDKQKGQLQKMAETYGYEVVTIRLTADFDVLWERRYTRDREHERHLSYIMDHYHYGDSLDDRRLATNHITKEAFKKIISDRNYDAFELGTLYEFDVTDYEKVDYTSLLDKLEQQIANDE
ncbi:zeta toxin family protein [Enterococcus sp. BWB1-3]|uniref:AAA family ATPase n=1 Tax=unclassified Enterococcus TaxID=2608891 RepID=UPI001922EE36|nr:MULTISPECIES: AAA family ATPase [unclassified Enterococcus]MBL1228244.1 zeta toxin family protein [Enterococcus sp. BWB1-3]MCB5955027.1 zeta toxin family protein [Enterococcus sp. CWB-B31]